MSHFVYNETHGLCCTGGCAEGGKGQCSCMNSLDLDGDGEPDLGLTGASKESSRALALHSRVWVSVDVMAAVSIALAPFIFFLGQSAT